MIVRMTGIVAEVHDGFAVLDRDGIGYEVLICGCTKGELSACLGEQVTLHMLEYLEGSAAGGNLTPRLVGFLHPEDRAFFTRFITVKNIGVRKAIKALEKPMGAVAAAIEAADARALSKLPGIGSRAADQIIAELKGKVAEFVLAEEQRGIPAPIGTEAWTGEQRDALEVMIALGERRAEAQRWLERAIQLHPGTTGTDEWVRLAYRVRSGAEG